MKWYSTSPRGTLLVTLCLLSTTRVIRAGFERSCSTDRHTHAPKGLCGHNLSMMLSTICRIYNKRGVGDAVPLTKRSITDDAVSNKDIFLPKKEALSFFKRDLSISGTITCECCVHQCGILELRQYCYEPEPLTGLKRGKAEDSTTSSPDDLEEEKEEEKEEEEEKEDEDQHLTQKRRIGMELLRNAPTWWTALNTLALNSEQNMGSSAVEQTAKRNMEKQ